MRLTIGKFATGIACALIAPLVFGTPGGPFENQVGNTLTNVGDNDPQDALGFVVGQICPGGLAPGIPGPGGSMGSPAGVTSWTGTSVIAVQRLWLHQVRFLRLPRLPVLN
jgi:hypothetical protein